MKGCGTWQCQVKPDIAAAIDGLAVPEQHQDQVSSNS